MESSVPQIVMIENNNADILLTKIALQAAGIRAEFNVFQTIEDGLDYLEDAILPSLVILDLNLFGEGGWSFLKMLRQNPRFNNLKVAVLTTHGSDEERERCMNLGATYFIQKSMIFDDFIKSLEILKPIYALSNAY